MAARRKANILGSRNMNSSKPLPTILSRKRKNDDEDVVQTVSLILDWSQRCLYLFVQDINSYLNTNNKSDHSENLQGISFANIQLSRPNSRWDSDSECWFRCWHFCSSRVPLATLSSSVENILSDSVEASPSPDLSYAIKLPDNTNSALTPLSSNVSPNSQKNRRKQTLSWKKPRMRDSWSQ